MRAAEQRTAHGGGCRHTHRLRQPRCRGEAFAQDGDVQTVGREYRRRAAALVDDACRRNPGKPAQQCERVLLLEDEVGRRDFGEKADSERIGERSVEGGFLDRSGSEDLP